jgi:hypothetical protein
MGDQMNIVNRTRFYVFPEEGESVLALVKQLENRGYLCQISRDTLDHLKLPLAVDVKEKTIECMGSAAIAACAASVGVIFSVSAFHDLFAENGYDL